MSAPSKRAGYLARWLARRARCTVDEAVERLAASQRARFVLTASVTELRADAEHAATVDERTGVRIVVDGCAVDVDERQLELAVAGVGRAA